MSKIDDNTRLMHMLDAAKRAERMAQQETRESLETDEKFSLAAVRLIEIIGEAASNVSFERKEEISNLPWPQIIGMRNRIVHAYFDVDYDVVWRTLTEDIPFLIYELEKVINS